jgi:hypothetical protein
MLPNSSPSMYVSMIVTVHSDLPGFTLVASAQGPVSATTQPPWRGSLTDIEQDAWTLTCRTVGVLIIDKSPTATEVISHCMTRWSILKGPSGREQLSGSFCVSLHAE